MNQIEASALIAAAPILDQILAAGQQFESDMGPNPAQWVANYPGAKLKLDGALLLAAPQLAVAEGGVVQAEITGVISGARAKLAALVAAAKVASTDTATATPPNTAIVATTRTA